MRVEMELPYDLPCTTRGQIDYLADLMGIKQKIHLHAVPPDIAVELLTLIVLYRHLDRAGVRRGGTLLQRVERRVLSVRRRPMGIPNGPGCGGRGPLASV